jgi:glycosyltransferase involved in cell wall biosynthesis
MYRNKTVSVVMPGRSVSSVLESQLSLIPQFVDEIILVSNRSKDNTVELAYELQKSYPKLKILIDDRCDSSGIGYGCAIQTGFAAASSTLVFKCDVDGTYPIEHLDRVIDHMDNSGSRIVSCNRYPKKEDSSTTLFHRTGVVVLNMLCWFITGYKINDILSGFYGGYSKDIRALNCTEKGWNYSLEFKLSAIEKFEDSYHEYHISQKQAQVKSHQAYWKTGFEHLKYLIRSGI